MLLTPICGFLHCSRVTGVKRLDNCHLVLPVTLLYPKWLFGFREALLKHELSNDQKFNHVANGKKCVICHVMKILPVI